MALGSYELELVKELKRRGYLDGNRSVVEIGTQQLSDGFLEASEQIEEAGRLFGAKTPNPLPQPRGANRGPLGESAPHARDFWTWLGFDYKAIDIDGADVRLDMNYESIAPELVGKYQLVTNFGTTEHIANQLNAFKVIHELTALGGLMIHRLPMQGMPNHGLINYNPKFFWMLARSNWYRTVRMGVSVDENYYPLPAEIMEGVAPFDPGFAARAKSYRVADAALTVVLQKAIDTPYVAPIDVPDAARPGDAAFVERYLPVFQPGKFAALASYEGVLDRVSGWRLQRELLSRYCRRLTNWLV